MVKKALLIGNHYPHFPEDHQLRSAYGDVDAVHAFLAHTVGFDDIVQMKDDIDPDDPQYPSRDNILDALENLVADAAEGDYLIFHFSGHGSQRDAENDSSEADGKDEAIWPADVEPNEDFTDGFNIILDDDIKANLVIPAADAGATLVIILDCCHSGTGADLQYSYTDPGEGSISPPKRKLALRKLIKGGDEYEEGPGAIVSWAACQDPHISISLAGSGGFFVKAFIDGFNRNWGATHQQLLHCIKERMVQEAQNHFQHLRAARVLTGKQLRMLERWWEKNRSEPVLGVLYNEARVLVTPVVDTLGYYASSEGVVSALADGARGFYQDTDFGGDWQDGNDNGFGNSSAGFDQGTGFDDGWQNGGMDGNAMANFAQDFQQDLSQDFGQDSNWF
ncbi:caspase family protein [Phanerochaete sordida]|uniref:Caspase family protein n=1 Tax=Phanerochaete sordida TaxID=48140 RepID=A0A9P3G0H8_9APHY|nr:caspase family protein [Phanerochaete sordida]